MKPIAVVSMVAAACFSQAQLKYTMYQNGVKIGEASVSEKLTKSGKTEAMRLTGAAQGVPFQMSSASVFDDAGAQRLETMSMNGGPASRSVTVTFKGNRAIVSVSNGGTKNANSIVAPATARLGDPSEFWFAKTTPKVGARVKATKFNVETLVWEETESVYVGDEKIKVSGRTLTAHKVTTTHAGQTGTVYLDSQGDILLYEENGVKLERKF